MATARGQITIVDLNDAKTVNMFLSSNHPTTQIFSQDGKTYTPDFSASNNALVITPELLISGVDNAIPYSVEWKINGDTVVGQGNQAAKYGASVDNSNFKLTITKNLTMAGDNVPDIPTLEIECTAQWYDESMNTYIPVKASIAFHRSINTGQLCMARIDSTGQYFKYDSNGPTPDHIELTAILMRGSQEDNTPGSGGDGAFSCTWYKREAETAQDNDGTIDGWRELPFSLENGSIERVDNTNPQSPKKWEKKSANVIWIYPDGVDSQDTFRIKIKDDYDKSAGYNNYFYDSYSIMDLTDPFSLEVTSSNGDTFKNGQISTTLSATVKSGGETVDVTKYNISYLWTKYDKNGNQVNDWSRNTASFSITNSDVSSKNTFMCTATIL